MRNERFEPSCEDKPSRMTKDRQCGSVETVWIKVQETGTVVCEAAIVWDVHVFQRWCNMWIAQQCFHFFFVVVVERVRRMSW